MKLYKLHFFFLLSVTGCASAIALSHEAVLHASHHRRDQGDSVQPVQSPKPATSITPPDTSDTPTAFVIATTSSTFSISTTSTQPTSTITSTAIPTSSSNQVATSTPTIISSSSTLTPSTTLITTPFAIPAAPLETSTQSSSSSSSSSSRTWVLLGIFVLAFGLLGLVIFILTPTRRRARKKRERGVKRKKVELLDVGGLKDEEMGRAGDANGRVGRGEGCIGVRGYNRGKEEDRGKWEEVREAKMEGEGDDEWEQGLPGYCR